MKFSNLKSGNTLVNISTMVAIFGLVVVAVLFRSKIPASCMEKIIFIGVFSMMVAGVGVVLRLKKASKNNKEFVKQDEFLNEWRKIKETKAALVVAMKSVRNREDAIDKRLVNLTKDETLLSDIKAGEIPLDSQYFTEYEGLGAFIPPEQAESAIAQIKASKRVVGELKPFLNDLLEIRNLAEKLKNGQSVSGILNDDFSGITREIEEIETTNLVS